MRLNYYRFPKDTPEHILIDNGCKETRYILNEQTGKFDEQTTITDTIEAISVSAAKSLLKQYGGSAWTEHCERDGSLFEVTEITLKGNNSRFKYNRHL